MFHFGIDLGQILVLFVQLISLGDRLLPDELNAVLTLSQIRINRAINFVSVAVVDALSELLPHLRLHRDRQPRLQVSQVLSGGVR